MSEYENPWAPAKPQPVARSLSTPNGEASTSRNSLDEANKNADANESTFENVSLGQDHPPQQQHATTINGKDKGKGRMQGFGNTQDPSLKQQPQQNRRPSSSVNPEQRETEVHSQPTAAPKTPSAKTSAKSLAKSKLAPSVLDKVVSRTRQRDLPPKPRDEDERHLSEYQSMLLLSKQHEVKREQLANARKAQREGLMASHAPIWEKEILPNWKAVRENEGLKKVWYSGSMPPRYRANLWSACIGNGLMVGKSSYVKSLALANSMISSSRFPLDKLDLLEKDVEITMPQLKLFQTEGPMHDDLRNLCLAYSVFWKEKPNYSHGISFIAAMLLLSMPIQDAFLALVNLISNTFLKYFYDGSQDYIDAYDRIFGTLLADHMPKVYHNFIANDIRPSLYLHPWLLTLYAHHLPLDCATRIFDVFALEGESFLFRIALTILQAMEARLFNPDIQELRELFEGRDRGARSIVAREKGKKEEQVLPSEVYEQIGCVEETIFGALEEMVWRESTWSRITERELPD